MAFAPTDGTDPNAQVDEAVSREGVLRLTSEGFYILSEGYRRDCPGYLSVKEDRIDTSGDIDGPDFNIGDVACHVSQPSAVTTLTLH